MMHHNKEERRWYYCNKNIAFCNQFRVGMILQQLLERFFNNHWYDFFFSLCWQNFSSHVHVDESCYETEIRHMILKSQPKRVFSLVFHQIIAGSSTCTSAFFVYCFISITHTNLSFSLSWHLYPFSLSQPDFNAYHLPLYSEHEITYSRIIFGYLWSNKAAAIDSFQRNNNYTSAKSTIYTQPTKWAVKTSEAVTRDVL